MTTQKVVSAPSILCALQSGSERGGKSTCTALVLTISLALGSACASATGTDVVPGVEPNFSTLIARCAPTVAPQTMAALVSAESRGKQFAIADAGPVRLPWAKRKTLVRSFNPGSLDAAVATAEYLISQGHTVSMGLTQINDRNLAGMGLTVRKVFEPCTNLAAGGRIFTDFYVKAVRTFGQGERAMRAALSAYNSGDWFRGERDGYVRIVYQQQGRALSMRTEGSVQAVPALAPAVSIALRLQKAGSWATTSEHPRSRAAGFTMASRSFTSDETKP